ncbi:MAG: Abi family protein [Bacilli bacterium]|nr:Abi family protein [Bacilli bacterium]
MKNKVFKNLDEQIDILQSKGLIIHDLEKSKHILLKENYFFLSGYRHVFMKDSKDKCFLDGTTFEELYALFTFDRNIRNIFFKNLLIIENNIKSLISYQMSRKYGFKEKDYLDSKNYSEDSLKIRQIRDVLDKVKRQIRVNGKKHSATIHYITNYGYIPLWILVKVLSFGLIGEFYNIFKEADKQELASFYSLNVTTFSIYLNVLSNYRNLCAHEDILFEHRTQREIPDNTFHKQLNISQYDDTYVYGKNDLYSVVIILKSLLSEQQFIDFINEIGYEIDIINGKISVIPIVKILHRMGFPDNWRDIVDLD